MLLNLHVKNLALIDEIEVDFFDHLNILTGETGAGKSILIGSIEAALGGKVNRDWIRQNAEYALIELLFSVEQEEVKEQLAQRDIVLEENQLMISRKIMPNRNVCRINGETVNLATLREVAALLLDLHGQQENLTLKDPANQLELLDQYAGEQAKELRTKCESQYEEYRKLKNEYENFIMDGDRMLREISFLEYEVKEIYEARLRPGEDEELEQQYKKQLNAKQIMGALGSVQRMTGTLGDNTVSSLLGQCLKEMTGVEEIDATTRSLYAQLGQMDALISDFNRELSEYLTDMTFDEEVYRETENRLNTINQLKAKYGNSISRIIEYAEEKEKELDKYKNAEKYREELKAACEKARKNLLATCSALSSIRNNYAQQMTKQIREVLIDLNFLQVEFSIVLEQEEEPTATGYDRVTFLISTNPGMPMRPIGQVASGGELSRIMLAVKSVLADVDQVQTLVFDEIDTGVSGRTAQMVAEKLNVISQKHQVICITHLPQIAAMADTHFRIAKKMAEDSTRTEIKMLYEEESVKELARLLGGAQITDTVMQSAKEMKKMAQESKRTF
ncbi:MAG: DNA repair protein RecN [Lachnospiraceae bacterium]|nr:DNA repair protein RecN [Lachnospiraceae bacterium]